MDNGGLVIYPTDTLYGLGASIYSEEGIRKIFHLKKRPASSPLSVAVSSISDIDNIASIDETNLRGFLEEIFPSKITVLLRRRDEVSRLLTGGTGHIGVRVPDELSSRKLLQITGPLTTTSVNLHGSTGNLRSEEIERLSEIAHKVDMFIKSEKLDNKLYRKTPPQGSTIISFIENKIEIIRKGEMKITDILRIGAKWGFDRQ